LRIWRQDHGSSHDRTRQAASPHLINTSESDGAFRTELILQIAHYLASTPFGLPTSPAHAFTHCQLPDTRTLVLFQQGQQAPANTATICKCSLNFIHRRRSNALFGEADQSC
jgi:hypothetical protein